jgi:hypothetical protein
MEKVTGSSCLEKSSQDKRQQVKYVTGGSALLVLFALVVDALIRQPD